MTDDIVAISVENVSKCYKLYHNFVLDPIKEALFFWRKDGFYREFWALKDVSFQVKRGEVVGIIGPNGAGKTTLLRMIAGLSEVTRGRIRVNGKLTALLTMGAGFHPEFTGRENILYGGLLLGMSKKEIERKMDAIIEFSELGDYIDHPFRTYSSGMMARLIFSTSISVDPDILVVDEALATGDLHFVNKCVERIHEICSSGTTLLYVSHSLRSIEELCSRALFIDQGRLVMDGEPEEVCEAYQRFVFEKEGTTTLQDFKVNQEEMQASRMGTGEVIVEKVELLDREGRQRSAFYTGDYMKLNIHYRVMAEAPLTKPAKFFVGFMLNDQFVGELNSHKYFAIEDGSVKYTSYFIERLARQGILSAEFSPLTLLTNHYKLWIIIYSEESFNISNYYCSYKNVAPFFVAKTYDVLSRSPIFSPPAIINHIPAEGDVSLSHQGGGEEAR